MLYVVCLVCIVWFVEVRFLERIYCFFTKCAKTYVFPCIHIRIHVHDIFCIIAGHTGMASFCLWFSAILFFYPLLCVSVWKMYFYLVKLSHVSPMTYEYSNHHLFLEMHPGLNHRQNFLYDCMHATIITPLLLMGYDCCMPSMLPSFPCIATCFP